MKLILTENNNGKNHYNILDRIKHLHTKGLPFITYKLLCKEMYDKLYL